MTEKNTRTAKARAFNVKELLEVLDNSRLVTTYDEFRQLIELFKAGHFNFVAVIGRAGIGRSFEAKQIMGNVRISGAATGWGIYSTIAQEIENGNHDPILVLNDLSPNFFRDDNGVALLKDLTEKHTPRIIQWATDKANQAGLSRSYKTGARVLLLANEFKVTNEHLLAILDRTSKVIIFDPTAYEVHVQAANWFKQYCQDYAKQIGERITVRQINELFRFMYDHLPAIPRNSFRRYQTVVEDFFAYPDTWQDEQLAVIYGGNTQQVLARKLAADKSYKSDRQRDIAFARELEPNITDKRLESLVRQYYRLRDALGLRDDPIGPNPRVR